MNLAKRNADLNIGVVHFSDPRVYAIRKSNPEMPSFNEAVSWEFYEQYI